MIPFNVMFRCQKDIRYVILMVLGMICVFPWFGCKKKETPVIYFYCSELFWAVMFEEARQFDGIYGVKTVLIPILPQSPSLSKGGEDDDLPSKRPQTIIELPDDDSKAQTIRQTMSWRGRPKYQRFLLPDQLILDHRLSGLIASFADEQQYGDLYLSDSPEQLEELRNQSLASHEYPFCYLTMVMPVAIGNPHDLQSVDMTLRKQLRLGIAAPSLYGMGSTAWDIIVKTPFALENQGQIENVLQEIIIPFDNHHQLLQALEHGEVDAVLIWDVLIDRTRDFATIVHIGRQPVEHTLDANLNSEIESSAEDGPDLEAKSETRYDLTSEHRAVPQLLVSLRVSDEPGFGRRFADFLISTQGQAVLRKHGFIPKSP